MLRSLDQQHVNCFLALLAARTCLFHATPKTGVSVLAFFPCFAPCVAAHTQKKKRMSTATWKCKLVFF